MTLCTLPPAQPNWLSHPANLLQNRHFRPDLASDVQNINPNRHTLDPNEPSTQNPEPARKRQSPAPRTQNHMASDVQNP